MMKVMISQPMNGKTDEEIRKERAPVVLALSDLGYYVVDTIFSEEPPADVKNRGLWYLAKSIEKMSEVDAMFFMSGWRNARGCVIERLCAEKYGLFILGEDL